MGARGANGSLPFFYKNRRSLFTKISNVKKTKVMKILKNYEGLKIVIDA